MSLSLSSSTKGNKEKKKHAQKKGEREKEWSLKGKGEQTNSSL